MLPQTNQTNTKVCVIGAGPNGLMTARHVSQAPNTKVTVFDAAPAVGGLWRYDERNDSEARFDAETKKDAFYQMNKYFHGSIYDDLKTVVPYFFMAYKDLCHADVIENIPLFVQRDQHRQYIEAYTDKFDLREMCQLSTLVKSVRLYDNLTAEEQTEAPEKRKFVVKTVDARGENLGAGVQVHAFDYVVVCTGHLSKPHIPHIEGIEKFEGKVMPAKNFRKNDCEFFKDKRILLLGSSYSAMDMLVQFTTGPESEQIKKLVMVGRSVAQFQTAEDFKQYRDNGKLEVVVGTIAEVTGPNTVKLSDGSEHEVDTIVLATGYKFNFPFLDKKDKLIDYDDTQYRGKFFGPVYKKFLSAREPNLLFIGCLDFTPLIYACYEYHALILRYVIEGKIVLPSSEEMIASFNQEVKTMKANDQTLAKFFNPSPLDYDIVYWNELRDIIKTARRSDEEKAKAYTEPLFVAYKKMMELLGRGDILTYEAHDYYQEFPRELRDTTEFI